MQEFIKLPFAHSKRLSPSECRFSMEERGTNVVVTVIHKETGRRASATGSAALKNKVRSDAFMKLTMLLYGGVTQ